MKNSYFQDKFRMLVIVFAIAIASLLVRALIAFNFHQSALLYVGIPFAISLVLILIRSPSERVSSKKHYLNRIIDAFIIMFASSVVLFEGFVCVVMFMPIYLTVILVMFALDFTKNRAVKNGRSTLNMHIIPLLVVISALEGITPLFSFNRDEHVSASHVVYSSVADIKYNLRQPIELNKSRPWFLYLFPMPIVINASSLTPGDVHKIYFRYYRWFFTNVHEGRMLLEISQVGNNYIKTKVLHDSSYISSYMRLNGTEIYLQSLGDRKTRVTLRIHFERKLDPFWYFSPLQRYGIGKMAEFLITEVIAREEN